MNQNDLQQFFEALKQHYPNVTAGDLELVGQAMHGLSYEQSMAALRSIRMSEKMAYRPSIPRFSERANQMREASRPPGQRFSRHIVSFIRYSSDSKDRVKIEDDIRAIEIHFKRAWATVQAECNDETALYAGRRMILGHCRWACIEIGWSDADALEFARAVVDLKPGEAIPKPTMLFQDMPKPDRQSPFQAIKALSVAEHGKPDKQLIDEFSTSFPAGGV